LRGVEEHLPHRVAGARAARLAGQQHVAPGGLEARGEALDLGRLARALGSLEDDEEPAARAGRGPGAVGRLGARGGATRGAVAGGRAAGALRGRLRPHSPVGSITNSVSSPKVASSFSASSRTPTVSVM